MKIGKRALRSWRDALPLLASLLLLSVVIAVVTSLGSQGLAVPPLTGGMTARGDEAQVLRTAFASLRLLLLALAGYCLGSTLLCLGARLTASAAAIRLGDALAVPLLRGAVQRAVGVSLVTTIVASPGVAAALPPTPAFEARELATPEEPERSPQPVELMGGGEPFPGEPPLRRPAPLQERAANPGTAGGRPQPALSVGGLLDEPTAGLDGDGPLGRDLAAVASPVVRTHSVGAGESLWSIAHDTLASSVPRTAPDEAAVADYWQVVVEHNRGELVDPGNPDLIFPGQVVSLPPIPGME